MTVIEELTLTMDPAHIQAYLAKDREVWTPFLESCDGYLGKEAWLPHDRPGTVVLIIRWASREQWKAITAAQVEAVDARMGALVPDTLECREYTLV